MNKTLKLIECPRDAIQGFPRPIGTEEKIQYLNQLLKVGFDTLDFGSFVSPKAIPQMADTAEVLSHLDWQNSGTKLLAIIANLRGAEEACQHQGVRYLGYPFSVSETFQLRNTQKTIADSMKLIEEMQALCQDKGKELVVYISMGFGNPYGDEWSAGIVGEWVEKIANAGVRILSLADTVGSADEATIAQLYSWLIPAFPEVEFGAHFHAHPMESKKKLQAAYDHGCRRFDSAMNGIGGCPFAKDDLVGNIATEKVLEFCAENEILLSLDADAFMKVNLTARQLFG
ncbi:MAG: hydroxymethylglutaryl-CoA lyase [Bacteroidia bacterium]|nr:hydroxymethylglutaryl-CoA lyase [Bacteroidia bacterium]